MPLEPSHPDEPGLHHQLRDALNAGLNNTNFFVWINVEPSGRFERFSGVEKLVETAEKCRDEARFYERPSPLEGGQRVAAVGARAAALAPACSGAGAPAAADRYREQWRGAGKHVAQLGFGLLPVPAVVGAGPRGHPSHCAP
jgi:hypothetical protein